jgi:hypothetical protein
MTMRLRSNKRMIQPGISHTMIGRLIDQVRTKTKRPKVSKARNRIGQMVRTSTRLKLSEATESQPRVLTTPLRRAIRRLELRAKATTPKDARTMTATSNP